MQGRGQQEVKGTFGKPAETRTLVPGYQTAIRLGISSCSTVIFNLPRSADGSSVGTVFRQRFWARSCWGSLCFRAHDLAVIDIGLHQAARFTFARREERTDPGLDAAARQRVRRSHAAAFLIGSRFHIDWRLGRTLRFCNRRRSEVGGSGIEALQHSSGIGSPTHGPVR